MNQREGASGPSATRDVEVFEVDVAGQTLMVVSLPTEPQLPARLSAAEQEVAEAALRGMSNAEIARHRGTAPRTVANQLASIYRKLGVVSRAELAAQLVADRGEGLR